MHTYRSSLLGALSVFFHVLFPWSICYVSHSWFNPRVYGYISFLNICLWSLNQSVQPFGLTTYLVCLSTWKKKQEIMSFYPALSPPMLSASVSNRACNVLALLQVWFYEKLGFIAEKLAAGCNHLQSHGIAIIYCKGHFLLFLVDHFKLPTSDLVPYVLFISSPKLVAVCCITPWDQDPLFKR